MRDFDLDHEIGRRTFEEAVGCGFSSDEGCPIGSGPFADVERAVRLQPGAGRVVPSTRRRVVRSPHRRAGHGARRGIDDVIENPREVVVKPRGSHQNDEPAHGIEADPTEPPIPVDDSQRGHGSGVGAQDVDAGPQEAPCTWWAGLRNAADARCASTTFTVARGSSRRRSCSGMTLPRIRRPDGADAASPAGRRWRNRARRAPFPPPGSARPSGLPGGR